MHQMQDMICKERPDGQGAENAWDGATLSTVKVVFADVL